MPGLVIGAGDPVGVIVRRHTGKTQHRIPGQVDGVELISRSRAGRPRGLHRCPARVRPIAVVAPTAGDRAADNGRSESPASCCQRAASRQRKLRGGGAGGGDLFAGSRKARQCAAACCKLGHLHAGTVASAAAVIRPALLPRLVAALFAQAFRYSLVVGDVFAGEAGGIEPCRLSLPSATAHSRSARSW